MPFTEPWYLESRAEAYAILRLTRASGLFVSRTTGIPGLDLLLSVGSGTSRSRHCGVVLHARLSDAEPARIGAETVEREGRQFAEAVLPICMLAFPAEHPTDDPTGEFRWIIEPHVQGSKAFLARNPSTGFQPLTDERLDQLVRDVNGWYALRSREDQLLAAGVHDISGHGDKLRKRRAG